MISLVGLWDLDPDRVLDLIIEGALQNYKIDIYLQLLGQFKQSSITYLLGNKLLDKYKKDQSNKVAYMGSIEEFLETDLFDIWKKDSLVPDPRMMKLLVSLVKVGIVSAEDIYNYTLPGQRQREEKGVQLLENGRVKVDKAFKMSLEELS